MAATKNINTPLRGPMSGSRYDYPVASGVRIFGGTMVGVNAAKEAVPIHNASAVAFVGIALDPADNRAGAAGAKRVLVGRGVFDGGALFVGAVAADINLPLYVVSDDELTKDEVAGSYLAATIEAVDEESVWIKV
ncbi:hypothetical protein [Fulvimarina sp. MAC3]|uniref:hypothetical protein n=1 Tax=Fulvimarina sp. MAC3 TaxID=3148887 RepID=UPI0031FDCA2E